MKHPATCALFLALFLTGCPQGPVRAKFSLEEGAAFFDAPFPVFTRVRAGGTLDWSAFPNPANNLAVTVYKAAADGGPPGAANGGAIFLPFTGSIDPATLPATPEESLAPEASAFLIDVDPASPERGRRLPLLAKFKPTGNALRADHLLALLPYPGVVLRPGTLYAAGVTRGVRDVQG
ncbi:MAG: hypothetical protein K8I02_08245, partial [Candidatus Methylomirabilis sp.]|nr:hypothetical protein [Deltaproteobacteria bacterium]